MSSIRQEWHEVTSPYQVKIGDRVRYRSPEGWKIGYDDNDNDNDKRFVKLIDDDNGNVIAKTDETGICCSYLFTDKRGVTEVLKEVEVKLIPINKNKVLEVKIKDHGFSDTYTFSINFNKGVPAILKGDTYYLSRSNAIRAAKKFCKDIGFECKIIKG